MSDVERLRAAAGGRCATRGVPVKSFCNTCERALRWRVVCGRGRTEPRSPPGLLRQPSTLKLRQGGEAGALNNRSLKTLERTSGQEVENI